MGGRQPPTLTKPSLRVMGGPKKCQVKTSHVVFFLSRNFSQQKNIGKPGWLNLLWASINDEADNFVRYCVFPLVPQPTILRRGD